MTDPAALLHAVAQVSEARRVRIRLDQSVGEWIADEAVGLQRRAEFLKDLRAVRLAFAEIEAIVESSVARSMTKNRQEIDGLELVRRGGSKLVWGDGGMATAIGWAIEAKFADLSTGEFADGFDLQTAYAVRDFLMEMYGSATIKTTPLKELGVDYGELAVREQSRRTVQVIDKTADDAGGTA